jgi:hypothetical protein
MIVRHWPKEYTVHQTEDGRIGSDSDCQRQYDNRGEAGLSAHGT